MHQLPVLLSTLQEKYHIQIYPLTNNENYPLLSQSSCQGHYHIITHLLTNSKPQHVLLLSIAQEKYQIHIHLIITIKHQHPPLLSTCQEWRHIEINLWTEPIYQHPVPFEQVKIELHSNPSSDHKQALASSSSFNRSRAVSHSSSSSDQSKHHPLPAPSTCQGQYHIQTNLCQQPLPLSTFKAQYHIRAHQDCKVSVNSSPYLYADSMFAPLSVSILASVFVTPMFTLCSSHRIILFSFMDSYPTSLASFFTCSLSIQLWCVSGKSNFENYSHQLSSKVPFPPWDLFIDFLEFNFGWRVAGLDQASPNASPFL